MNKLKKQEEKIVFEKIKSVHEKEKQFLNNKYGEMYKTFVSKKNTENNKFNNQIKGMKNDFEKKQRLERENFPTKFRKEYPKEEKISKELVSINKRIKYFVEKRDYEQADKLKKKIEKDKERKHEEYLEKMGRDYNQSLNKLRYFQQKEKEENDKKIDNLIWKQNLKNNTAYKNFNTFKDNNFKRVKDIQNEELNDFKNVVFSENNEKGIPISNRIKKINY